MPEFYRIHFGFSKSKRYPQALELAKLAYKHEVKGAGKEIWHTVIFKENQIDLMAALYNVSMNLGKFRVYGVYVVSLQLYLRYRYPKNQYMKEFDRYTSQGFFERLSTEEKERFRFATTKLKLESGKSLKELYDYLAENYDQPYADDMRKVWEKLREEGYLDIKNRYGLIIQPAKKPKEHILGYKETKELIANGKYEEAIRKYYDALGDKFYGELHNELIYLKRLAELPLTSRDLLYFRTESTRNDLINSNLFEYCSCIDAVLEQYRKAGMKTPLDVLIENAPTMEDLIKQREQGFNKSVSLMDSLFKRRTFQVNIDSFHPAQDKCFKGRLFDKYPDQVELCKVIEAPQDRTYTGLWTTFSPSYYQREILDKGLHLNGIEAYSYNFKLWRKRTDVRSAKPEFTTATSLSEVEKGNYWTDGIRYTGRKHEVEGQEFYKIDLLRENLDLARVVGNPFLELVEEILREAENLLRENHGLPRIGEGWISEMQLYDLVKNFFPEAQHHASPKWLKPQHLDVFVPSKKLAFEYQGKQHFEPVDFFGGEESFETTKMLDQRKKQKCKSKGVLLIYWRYDEPINKKVLTQKLKGENIPRHRPSP